MPALRLPPATPSPLRAHRAAGHAALAAALLMACAWGAMAQDHSPAAPKPAAKPPSTATTNPAAKAIGQQVREAVEAGIDPNKQVTLMVDGKEKRITPTAAPRPATSHGGSTAHAPAPIVVAAPGAIPNPVAARQQAARARAAAAVGHSTPAAGEHGGEVHWSYEGEGGPQSWGKLKPEFNVCAIGKRQSPINIEESATLRGPAEPIQFEYTPSTASVVNNGHTIQVDVAGDNSITVRGTNYKLLQFHFHHPSEERVNFRSFSMVAHLVHRNPEGQLAVVAVLLDPGEANALINKVWTYMPLDSGDRVRMPPGLLNLNELLPKDQRYYQFIGSLTTPPCTEGVLWMVLKQPVAISRDQLRLFSQLFPNNARPVQPVNGRAIRDAQ
jgi:carbonic anhydrase